MIYTFLIGLLIGIVAKMLMPGRDPGGFIMSVVGAMLLLWGYRSLAPANA